jgi:septum formation protein
MKAVMSMVREKGIGDCIILTSDQVIACNGKIREKPVDEEECRQFLQSYSDGVAAVCVCSVVVHNTATHLTVEGSAQAIQHFLLLPPSLVDQLIAQGDVLRCAGGFTIEHMSGYLGNREGEEETIMGLPRTLTSQLLQSVM